MTKNKKDKNDSADDSNAKKDQAEPKGDACPEGETKNAEGNREPKADSEKPQVEKPVDNADSEWKKKYEALLDSQLVSKGFPKDKLDSMCVYEKQGALKALENVKTDSVGAEYVPPNTADEKKDSMFATVDKKDSERSVVTVDYEKFYGKPNDTLININKRRGGF